MTRGITKTLADWLAAIPRGVAGEAPATARGARVLPGATDAGTIGEIRIQPSGSGFALCHRDDFQRGDLEIFTGSEAARSLANFDDRGKFRPLKTAPNLRHGWKLGVGDVHELRRALYYFYPAMLGLRRSHLLGELVPVPLRETLGRQSGMYAVTKKVTDAQADSVIGGFCKTDGGCLKRILWPVASSVPITSLPAAKFNSESEAGELPLLCHEGCNLLVARIREELRKAGREGAKE